MYEGEEGKGAEEGRTALHVLRGAVVPRRHPAETGWGVGGFFQPDLLGVHWEGSDPNPQLLREDVACYMRNASFRTKCELTPAFGVSLPG